MKKYLTQRTVNVIAIAGAVAWGLCAIFPNNSTRSNNGLPEIFVNLGIGTIVSP